MRRQLVGNVEFLSIQNMVKAFGSHCVLRDVSLDVRPGEMLCILGPSGCGKTTLLRCIAGLEKPDSGRLAFTGADIVSLAPQKRHFGFVFQNYALFPNMTVAANIGYGLRGPKWPTSRRCERIDELLALVALSEYSGHYPAQLSGGQQQRIALSRAIAPAPSLLLLDEPLSALDAQVRSQLREDLRSILRRVGITAILVTHDQQEALTLADRIVVMRDGRIEQVAEPEALYHNPATRFVAEFIGAMNVLSFPGYNEGLPFGVRYEDVQVKEATEATLGRPHTVVARAESCRLFGPFRRLELVLNDQRTRVFADLPAVNENADLFEAGSLAAVTFPESRWRTWGKE